MNHTASDNEHHILVVGDFMIDQEWILSGNPLPTVQSHGLIKPMQRINPTWRCDRLGGAGMALMALKTLFSADPDKKVVLHGLGLWKNEDHPRLVQLCNSSQDDRVLVHLHRLQTQQGLEDNDDIVTTTKLRFYTQLAEEMPRLINRYDQDPEPDPELSPCSNIYSDSALQGFKDFLASAYPNEVDSIPNKFKAILIADFNKGVVQEDLLNWLQNLFKDNNTLKWLIDSKNPEILQVLPNGLKVSLLTFNREEAIRILQSKNSQDGGSDIFSVARGLQPNIDLLYTIKELKKRIELIKENKRSLYVDNLLIKLDSDGACLHDLSQTGDNDDTFLCQPEKPIDCPGIAAGDFFNAALLRCLLSSTWSDKGGSLQSACVYASEWLMLNRLYWSDLHHFRRDKRSDVVLPSFLANETVQNEVKLQRLKWDQNHKFNLEKKERDLLKCFSFHTIVNPDENGIILNRIMLSDAKGFLGDYMSTSQIMRNRIRGFTDQLYNYCISQGRVRPLNCLVTATAGTGKSFFVKQLANKLSCGLVKINCSQITTSGELLNALSQLKDINEKTPLLFLDEIDQFDEGSDHYRVLLAPLWDASILINGKAIKWTTRYITILSSAALMQLAEAQLRVNVKDTSGDGGKVQVNQIMDRLLSLINGPRLVLNEKTEDEEERQRMQTQNIYIAIDIILKYHESSRYIERRFLDLIYCAPKFNARSFEHFVSSLPSPGDGIIKLSSVSAPRLCIFLASFGYTLEGQACHPIKFKVTGTIRTSLKELYSIVFDRSNVISTEDLSKSLLRIISSHLQP